MTHSRRQFIRQMAAAGSLGALGHLSSLPAHASLASGYKALVCIFLYGGNDCHNTVIPISGTGQTQYNQVRGGSSVHIVPTAAMSINGQYALHEKLATSAVANKNLKALFAAGRLAVLANVGSLAGPNTTKTSYPYGLPDTLFSHSDQQNQWQAARPSNTLLGSGWGGRIADEFPRTQAQLPVGMNAGTGGLFNGGVTSRPTAASPADTPQQSVKQLEISKYGAWASVDTGHRNLVETRTFNHGVKLIQAADAITHKGRIDSQTLYTALGSAQSFPAFPNTDLGRQLRLVAQIVSVSAEAASPKQVFFVSLGGFDTHGYQAGAHTALLQQVNDAMVAFDDAMGALTARSMVTAFTCSEFGRALQPSINEGTDHGWGGHQFILGGAVNGGQMYGAFPSLALGSDDDFTGRGTLIPTTGVQQYGATLAKWFGVQDTRLTSVFPGLDNWPVAQRTLAFMQQP